MGYVPEGREQPSLTIAQRTRVSAVRAQPLPDILAFLQRETELTRGTLVKILKASGRLQDFTINPESFMTETAKLINRVFHELIIDGIKYEPLPGQYYEMRLYEEKEVKEYMNSLYEVQSSDNRSYMMCSSNPENMVLTTMRLVESNENSNIRLNANGGNSILLVCEPIYELDYIEAINNDNVKVIKNPGE